MPPTPLPHNPSLEHLRKDAKRLLKAVRAADPSALARVEELHPRGEKAVAAFQLSDAQLVMARTYGFASWTKLKRHLHTIRPFVWNPPAEPSDPAAVDEIFVRLACLTYGAWHRSNPARAERLLADHPEVARPSLYTAAAAGDVAAVRAALDRDPESAHAKGGPFGWEPLLYACYSRMPDRAGRSTLAVARLLLERGADPNAGFLWGATYVFTALTGAFGEGEDNVHQLPHPRRDALARLLLDAGADPNDAQTLYNRHFREDDGHLELLFSYGLGTAKGGPWFERQGERAESPARLLAEELWSAAKNGRLERVKLLIAHGVDVNTPGLRDGRTPYEEALRAGHGQIAEYLLRHGATKIELDRVERFGVACVAGRPDEAAALLAADPRLLDELGEAGRVELMHRAVETGRPDPVRLAVDLGLDVNALLPGTGYDRSPLHGAAIDGDLEMVKLLLSLGADPHLEDPTYGSAPIGWAAHGQQRHVVEHLLQFADVFDALRCDGVERVAELLREEPARVDATDAGGNPLCCYLHPELARLAEMVQLLKSYGCDFNRRLPRGGTLVDRALARGWIELAELLRRHGARASRELAQ